IRLWISLLKAKQERELLARSGATTMGAFPNWSCIIRPMVMLPTMLVFALAHGGALPGQQAAKPAFQDGQAQVVPAFADAKDWIQENLWVETEFDSDHNGKRDRVYV